MPNLARKDEPLDCLHVSDDQLVDLYFCIRLPCKDWMIRYLREPNVQTLQREQQICLERGQRASVTSTPFRHPKAA